MEIEEKIAFQKSRQKELEEAVRAGRRAQDIAVEIKNHLDKAKSWSTVDIIGGRYLVSSALCFADYFFDNLFTDWLVRTRINESREKVDQTCTQIQKILQNLGSKQEESVRVQSQLEEELEEAVTASDAV